MNKIFYFLAISLLIACQAETDKTTTPLTTEVIDTATKSDAKIIALNGTITELLYEMNLGNNIIGVDRTSTFPEATQSITNLGHITQLNAEAILALQPTIVLVDKKNESNEILEQIKTAGVQVEAIDIPYTLEGSIMATQQLNSLLSIETSTSALQEKITRNKAKIQAITATSEKQPKVLFIYARGAQTLMVAGDNTFASAMIKIAGGTPAITEFESFKPLTPEALLANQPEVILLFDSGLESLANEEEQKTAIEGLLAIPGMDKTPAGKQKRIIAMDGAYLSGFGPRASDAALELAQKIHESK